VQGREFFFGVSPWVRHNRIHIVQGFGDADLQFLIEVVLFGSEVEGHGQCFRVMEPEEILQGSYQKKLRTRRDEFFTPTEKTLLLSRFFSEPYPVR
jgi:hypothetical protein